MKRKCKSCGQEYRIELPLVDGQEIVCPYCGETAVYQAPTRIEVPAGVRRTPASEPHPETPSVTEPGMQPVSRFHVIRPANGAGTAVPSEKDNALVERVRSRSRTEARRQILRKIKIVVKDLFWLLVLVALVMGGWRLFLAWKGSRPTAVQTQPQAERINPPESAAPATVGHMAQESAPIRRERIRLGVALRHEDGPRVAGLRQRPHERPRGRQIACKAEIL